MSSAGQIIEEVRRADLLLVRAGKDRLRLLSPSGRPLPEELRRRIVEHRAELLAWLAWNEWADEQLLAMTRRIAAHYVTGAPLDGERWRRGEQELDAAYRAHESATLMAAIERYEESAYRCFADHRAQTRRKGRR